MTTRALRPPKRAPLLQRISLLFGARRQVLQDGRVQQLRLFATAGLGAVLGRRYRGDGNILSVDGAGGGRCSVLRPSARQSSA